MMEYTFICMFYLSSFFLHLKADFMNLRLSSVKLSWCAESRINLQLTGNNSLKLVSVARERFLDGEGGGKKYEI